VSDDKDLITDTVELNSYIKDHDALVTDTYQDFWNAYSCNSRILDTTLVPSKSLNKPDYRIATNYPRYVVDTYNGFARGIPVKVSSDEESVTEFVRHVSDINDLDNVNIEIHKAKCIFGEAYQIVYMDEDGEIGTIASDPLESFPIYNNSIKPKLRYFVRTYYDEDGNRHGSISDDTHVYYFDISGGEIVYTEQYEHGFPSVPAIVYTMNSARIGLVEVILPMCDALDKIISEKMNDVDSFSDAIMKVIGPKLTEKQVTDLRDRRIINIDGTEAQNSTVEFLSRQSGDDTQEHLIDHLIDMIHTVSMVCNISDDTFATSSGIALKMKMQTMTNLASGDWLIDRSAMKRFWELVFGHAATSVNEEEWSALQFNHTLNYPDDQSYAADTATKLSGIVSHRTQLAVLPASIVPDIDKELEQIAKEEEDGTSVDTSDDTTDTSTESSNISTDTSTEDTQTDLGE
jgi:SPP1 family phage portal protein